jgi:uncharacterized protein (DUF885 family)
VSATDDFRRLAVEVVDDLLERDPVDATAQGDHRFDASLPDLSADGVAASVRSLEDHVMRLDAVDDVELDVADLVDLEILRARLTRGRFELSELRAHTWNPMVWNPGTALNLLVSREFAPADERRTSLRGRLRAIPDFLAAARGQLSEMSAVHVETAIGQLHGTASLIDGDVRALAADDAAVDAAMREVQSFREWLEERCETSHRSPRLGQRL